MQYPDYQKSGLNALASVLKHYGVNLSTPTLPLLDSLLTSQYKNIIFLIFDGLGANFLQKLPDSYLFKHQIATLTSLYPSTTTAVMNSYYSGLPPLTHGWLGWNGYFKEFDAYIDLFSGYEGEKPTTHPYRPLIAYEDIFSKIRRVNDLCLYSLFPNFIKANYDSTMIPYKNEEDMFVKLSELCNTPQQKFIQAYCYRPDDLMHDHGPNSPIVFDYVSKLDAQIKQFASELKDTLLIISADHGQIEVENNYYLDEINELNYMLERRTCLEPRFVSIFVKPQFIEEFPKKFNKLFKDEFLLLSKQEILKQNILGTGDIHPKSLDFLGDYLALGIGKSQLHYQRGGHCFKGHHAGLHEDEMLIPLIVVRS